MNQRDHALETAARMIERRIVGLEMELVEDEKRGLSCAPSDRACILEAKYIVNQVRGLIGKRLKPFSPTGQ